MNKTPKLMFNPQHAWKNAQWSVRGGWPLTEVGLYPFFALLKLYKFIVFFSIKHSNSLDQSFTLTY